MRRGIVNAAQEGVSAIQKKQNELKQMETRKKEIQLYLKESFLAEQDARKRVNELSSDIETLQLKIVQTTRQQKHTENVLSRQTKEVEILKHLIEKDEESLRQRVRSIYKFLKGKQALSFFQDRNSSKNQHLLELVLRHEVQHLQNYYKKSHSLEQLLGPYQQRQSIQEELFHESSEVKKLLEQKKQEHQRLLVAIQQDRQVYVRFLDDLQQSMEKVIDDLDKLELQEQLARRFIQSSGLFPLKGKLLPPVEGRMIQSYQDKSSHSVSNLYRGITIETRPDSPVSAIAAGKIVFAEALKGYHQLVIVDHGKNSFSVYGKLENLEVRLNEFVESGSIIGTVSKEPITSKFQIYFEIRHRGKPVDPLDWLKPKTFRR
ncbi:MAG: peptidoglycan DD-metalloendopeptidase family protein [SAR324 cluster bacterium]|nr:peptidoglycan DD-metalloendopeptidase family protein [SAR324 cluster bacterium]